MGKWYARIGSRYFKNAAELEKYYQETYNDNHGSWKGIVSASQNNSAGKDSEQ